MAGRAAIAAASIVAAAGGAAGDVSAQTALKVVVFAGMSNLAQFAAEEQGYFKKRGLSVELINTPNSTELRRGLAEGRYQIAHGGVDNAVAQVETDKTDLFIFMGGNNGLNSLFVQPEITSYEQLRGKTMAVDSPNTAFALLLYKMLDVKGIKRKEFEACPARYCGSGRPIPTVTERHAWSTWAAVSTAGACAAQSVSHHSRR
jgi:ABC-type nitrate/sulfonate/bicarbonate transport system substrate-binding protein